VLVHIGAKVVGGLVALPVVCGVAGIALVAVTVAAPFYGVYRVVKRVRRPPAPDQFPRYNADAVSDWDSDYTDFDFDLQNDEMPVPEFAEPVSLFRERLAAAAELRRPPRSIPLHERLPTAGEDIEIEDVGSIEIEDLEETLPPPLPPRRPIYRAAVEPRRGPTMNSPLDLCSDELNEDAEIKSVEEPATPPPLPPRQPIRRAGLTASVRGHPPAVKPPSLRHVIMNAHDYKSFAPETAFEQVTHL